MPRPGPGASSWPKRLRDGHALSGLWYSSVLRLAAPSVGVFVPEQSTSLPFRSASVSSSQAEMFKVSLTVV